MRNCDKLRKENPVWSENCAYPQATGKLDTSMATPTDLLYMASFSYSTAGGLPMCLPLWYRFRYVNSKSGNYSNFSKWSCSAVTAGGTNLPCVGCTEGSCSDKISGPASCSFNRVVMGVTTDLQYNTLSPTGDGSINAAVVYRYVGKSTDVDTPPSDDPTIGEPLGMLALTSSYSGYTNVFTDIGNNPCPAINTSAGCPSRCSAC